MFERGGILRAVVADAARRCIMFSVVDCLIDIAASLPNSFLVLPICRRPWVMEVCTLCAVGESRKWLGALVWYRRKGSRGGRLRSCPINVY